MSHETPPAAGASFKARSPAQDRDSLAADHDAIGFISDADVLRFERGLRKRPGPPDRIRRARACHNAPDDGRVRLTRACTHKSLSRVRFRANRTSSRRRRTTESDPRRSLAGSKYRIAANPRKHWNELRLLQARGGNTAITSTSSRNPSRASRTTCTAVEGGGVSLLT